MRSKGFVIALSILSIVAGVAVGYMLGSSGVRDRAKQAMNEGYSNGLKHGLSYGRYYGQRLVTADDQGRNLLLDRCAEESARIGEFIHSKGLTVDKDQLFRDAIADLERRSLERMKANLENMDKPAK